jgi:hypothetical protein
MPDPMQPHPEMIIRSIMKLVIPLVLGAAAAAPSRTVWDGVYSKEQVERG